MSRTRGAEPSSLCRQVRVALLHLAPVAGEVDRNLESIEHGIAVAVAAGADLIVTPDLATTGYSFADRIGTAWIRPSPDTITRELCAMARRHGVDVFLGHVERDEAKGTLHNALFAIGKVGDVLARHRKRNTLRVGAEAWSTPGIEDTVVALDSGLKVGLLVCADACSPTIARAFDDRGASLLLSAACWAPGAYGPAGEWERLSDETGLPLFVCNRAGDDPALSFVGAESVVVQGGELVATMAPPRSTAFVLAWDPNRARFAESAGVSLDE